VRSTTFLFTTWCTLVEKFRVNLSQTLPVWHILADRDAARAPARPHARACAAPTSASGPTRAFPRPLLLEAGSTPRPLKSAPTPRGVLALVAIRARCCPPVRCRFPLHARAVRGRSPYCELKAGGFLSRWRHALSPPIKPSHTVPPHAPTSSTAHWAPSPRHWRPNGKLVVAARATTTQPSQPFP
jgi:hypothetical protein